MTDARAAAGQLGGDLMIRILSALYQGFELLVICGTYVVAPKDTLMVC